MQVVVETIPDLTPTTPAPTRGPVAELTLDQAAIFQENPLDLVWQDPLSLFGIRIGG